MEVFRNGGDAGIDEKSIDSMYKWLTDDLKPNTVAIEIGPDAANYAMHLARFEKISRIYIVGHDHKKAGRKIGNSVLGRKISNTEMRLRPDNPTALRHYILHNADFHWPIIMRCDIGGSEEKLFSNIESNELLGVSKLILNVYGTENAMVRILENAGFKTEYKPSNGILSKRSGTVYAWR